MRFTRDSYFSLVTPLITAGKLLEEKGNRRSEDLSSAIDIFVSQETIVGIFVS